MGEMGELVKTGEFTPCVVGEMGESSKELTHSPTHLPAVVVKQPAPETLQCNINDEALTFARQLRTRFAECRLTYHANGDAVRGKRPYWWAEVAR